jgi:hypothetical protein
MATAKTNERNSSFPQRLDTDDLVRLAETIANRLGGGDRKCAGCDGEAHRHEPRLRHRAGWRPSLVGGRVMNHRADPHEGHCFSGSRPGCVLRQRFRRAETLLLR